MNIHFDTHSVLDIDQDVATSLSVERFYQRERSMSDSGRVDERERERTGWNVNLLDGFGAIATPDLSQTGILKRLESCGQGFSCGEAFFRKDELCKLVTDNLERRTAVFVPYAANQTLAGAREKLKVDTTPPIIFLSRGKELGVIREKLVLRSDPRTTFTNRQSVRIRNSISPRRIVGGC
jgi:hypothetical protein